MLGSDEERNCALADWATLERLGKTRTAARTIAIHTATISQRNRRSNLPMAPNTWVLPECSSARCSTGVPRGRGSTARRRRRVELVDDPFDHRVARSPSMLQPPVL